MIRTNRTLHVLFLLGLSTGLQAQKDGYKFNAEIPYYEAEIRSSDAYVNERCLLDIYYPEKPEGFPTIVWFHGGGLEEGHKYLPEGLKNQGVAVVTVNYRLYPKANTSDCIEDAAAAVAWVFDHIRDYGGDPSKIFISGHSAGGYLASMVGLDKKWLARYGIDANQIAGLIPFSGHMITHMTVRKERGIPETQPVVDDYAPLYHVRADAPPLLLITGDRELEMLGRYEENAYMMRMMKVAGHGEVKLYELDGYGHGMVEPAVPLLLKEVRRIIETR